MSTLQLRYDDTVPAGYPERHRNFDVDVNDEIAADVGEAEAELPVPGPRRR